MQRRDRSSDEMLTMALAARRKRSTKYAPQPPARVEPTAQEEAVIDLLKSLTTKGLKLFRRYAKEFLELDAEGQLYRGDAGHARKFGLPSPLPPRRDVEP